MLFSNGMYPNSPGGIRRFALKDPIAASNLGLLLLWTAWTLWILCSNSPCFKYSLSWLAFFQFNLSTCHTYTIHNRYLSISFLFEVVPGLERACPYLAELLNICAITAYSSCIAHLDSMLWISTPKSQSWIAASIQVFMLYGN